MNTCIHWDFPTHSQCDRPARFVISDPLAPGADPMGFCAEHIADREAPARDFGLSIEPIQPEQSE